MNSFFDQGPKVLVRVGATPANRNAAILEAGQLLVAAGCAAPDYVQGMIRREAMADTFLGAGVSIPHGQLEDKRHVRRDGVAILQIPEGVEWGSANRVRLVVALAASSDTHMTLLKRLTRLIGDSRRLAVVCATPDPGIIEACLGEITPGECPVQGCAPAVPGGVLETVRVVLPYAGGLHARPAAQWVEAARSLTVPLCVRHANGNADPRDLLSLLQLGVRFGDALDISVDITAHGPTGAVALEKFCRAVLALESQEDEGSCPAALCDTALHGVCPPDGLENAKSADCVQLCGIGAGPGLGVGVVCRLDIGNLLIPDTPMPLLEGGTILEEAIEKTRLLMQGLVDDTTRRLGPEDAGIFKAQLTLLDDTQLITLACRHMVAGHGPAWSWNAAVEESARAIAGLPSAALAGRAADLRDVGRRVLLQLVPELARQDAAFPETPFILVAEDLSPSDTVGLDDTRVAGLVTEQGGPTSHTAILARTMGLAAVVAVPSALDAARNGDMAVVDGDSGRVWLNASPGMVAAAQTRADSLRTRRAAEAAQRGLPAVTVDGVHVEIRANVNRPDQVSLALEYGAEGVGLMRTELLFLERGTVPDEAEQHAVYRDMLAALGGKPLTVRALDIGGDKQVAHLCLPREANPFLGVRGARLLLRRADLFEPQMRALYRAAAEVDSPGTQLEIMFAMVSSVREVRELREHCERVRRAVCGQNAPEIPIGIMIEVPAAALMARELAEYVDFFSIGTNDLTQYTLAMDRQNPALAAEADSLHPAVLRLMRLTVEGAATRNRRVGVCGGLAGEPFGAALLVGLGVRELSMTPRDIPAIKALLRRHSLTELAALSERALACSTVEDVRALARLCVEPLPSSIRDSESA